MRHSIRAYLRRASHYGPNVPELSESHMKRRSWVQTCRVRPAIGHLDRGSRRPPPPSEICLRPLEAASSGALFVSDFWSWMHSLAGRAIWRRRGAAAASLSSELARSSRRNTLPRVHVRNGGRRRATFPVVERPSVGGRIDRTSGGHSP